MHPDGVTELYLGQVKGPRIDLATDAVMRTASAKEYAAATRLYGLVDEPPAVGVGHRRPRPGAASHASGRLAKAE